MTIQARHEDHFFHLVSAHSYLVFTRAGASDWVLRQGEKTLLKSGAGWAHPASRILEWKIEGEKATITTDAGALTLTDLGNGWRLAFDHAAHAAFDLASGGHWYGQGELIHQVWPLEKISLPAAPFLTWDNGPTGIGNILTPLWLTSSGVAILVPSVTEALHVSLNATDNRVVVQDEFGGDNSLEAAAQRPVLAQPGVDGRLLLYMPEKPLSIDLLVADDLPGAFHQAVEVLGKPTQTPPPGLLRAPIWTTWARYKADINQNLVLAFAREIRHQDFPGATLEIDDKWQEHYGDTAFDPLRFPDAAAMVGRLNDLDFAVTAWTTPFFHPDSPNAQEAAANGFVVKRPDRTPYLVKWWQGHGYLLDVSNPTALEWWAGKLMALRRATGLAGYKFDAGEGAFLPADAVTHAPLSRNDYGTRWAHFAAQHTPYGEVRCGWYNQQDAILFRHWDKFSGWGLNNGLASVVTTALALSLTGYPFSLPDMVGGNAYNGIEADGEMLIRWTQASAPMLAMQFSLAPWDYGEETAALCRRYAQLHVDLFDQRMNAAREAVASGAPVIRPVFWHSPHDETAQTVADAYLLGADLLVAPVVTPGAATRDIYLPAGNWQAYDGGGANGGANGGEVIAGERWLRDYPAPLETLPLFRRMV
ncbi:MAG: glycoside hydrolase family 31 protein [bacterium]|nr:glycoside hydrolase family 31 protein [bacterium]